MSMQYRDKRELAFPWTGLTKRLLAFLSPMRKLLFPSRNESQTFFACLHISQVYSSVSRVHATSRTIFYNFGAGENICDLRTIHDHTL